MPNDTKMHPIAIPIYSCPKCYLILDQTISVKDTNLFPRNPQDDLIVFKHSSTYEPNCPFSGQSFAIPLYKFVNNDFADKS